MYGVRRTTGQHPGGIIVLPHGMRRSIFYPGTASGERYDDSDIITTHFDYHSIDHNLLKLDILGHDDPTMIRMLEDLTRMSTMRIRQTIPLDDQGSCLCFHRIPIGTWYHAGGYRRNVSWDVLESRSLVQISLCRCYRYEAERFFGSDAYFRTFPWYGCMAWKCTDTD